MAVSLLLIRANVDKKDKEDLMTQLLSASFLHSEAIELQQHSGDAAVERGRGQSE